MPTIQQAATAYFQEHLTSSQALTAHDDFMALQDQLAKLATPAQQTAYLTQIAEELQAQLQTHRDTFHGGQPKPTCKKEIRIEQLRSYIQQELVTLSHLG